jgi:hypothetical protein
MPALASGDPKKGTRSAPPGRHVARYLTGWLTDYQRIFVIVAPLHRHAGAGPKRMTQ